MAASLVQTERKSMGVKEVNQSHYEQALGEVLRTRHDRVLGRYRLFALQTDIIIVNSEISWGFIFSRITSIDMYAMLESGEVLDCIAS